MFERIPRTFASGLELFVDCNDLRCAAPLPRGNLDSGLRSRQCDVAVYVGPLVACNRGR